MKLKIAYSLLLTVSLLFFACEPKKEASSFPSPGQVEDTKNHFIVTTNVDTVPTGVPIPAIGKRIDPGSLAKPTSFKFSGKTKEIPAYPNVRVVGTPSVIEVLEELTVITPGENGVPLPKEGTARPKVVPALQPQPIPASGLTFKSEATASIQNLSYEYWPNSSNIYAICEDSRGNIWFGSGDGVSRYDGHSISHYTPEHGLSGTDVRCILEDSRGNLWFGTEGGGVNRFNGKTFAHYTTKEGLGDNTVRSIYEDRNGNLWFGTNHGVSRFDPDPEGNGGGFLHFTKREGLTDNIVRTILEDRKGNFWYGTLRGMSRYEPDETGKSGRFTHYTKNEGLIDHTVQAMLEDSNGNLWIGTQHGLSRFDPDANNGLGSFSNFTTEAGLISHRIWSILEDRWGSIWFGSSQGAIRYDPDAIAGKPYGKRGTFEHFTAQEGLGGDLVNSMLEDSQGNIWFGLLPGGVSRFHNTRFEYFTQKNGLISQTIRSMTEDNQGNIWIGSLLLGAVRYATPDHGSASGSFSQYLVKEGFNVNGARYIMPDSRGNIWFLNGAAIISAVRYTPDNPDYYSKGTVTHFSVSAGMSGNHVFCIMEDSRGNIWFGTNQGVTCYNPGSERERRGESYIHFTTEEGLVSDKVQYMLEDGKGNIWMGTDQGLSCYIPDDERNQESGHFIHFTDQEGLGGNDIRYIWEDSREDLWIGTDHGLSRFTRNKAEEVVPQRKPKVTGQFTSFTSKDGLSGHSVECMLEDSRGHLWFGTENGLSRYHPGNDQQKNTANGFFTSYTIREALGQNRIRSIAEDKQQRIWASAKGRIMLLVPSAMEAAASATDSYRLITFNRESGLLYADFMSHYVYQDRSNQIWWSSNQGLIRLDLDQFEVPSHLPRLQLNTVAIDQTFIDYRRLTDTSYRHQLAFGNSLQGSFDSVPAFKNYPLGWSLPHHLNDLTFHFSAIDWQAPSVLHYRHFLEGLDDDWSQPTKENKAEYRKLPPGSYTFKVKAIGAAQIWSDVFAFDFRILPPWWSSWPAFLSYGGSLLCLLYLMYRFLLNRRLQLAEDSRLKELNTYKIHLYANITHEFRTPLTIILGMARQIREDPKRWYHEGLQMINRNGRQLLNLVNQMLDLNKMDKGKLKLNMQQGEVVSFVNYLVQSFESFAAGKKIQVHFLKELSQLEMDFDQDQLTKVVSNLLSNAVKFTPNGGQVYVTLRTKGGKPTEFPEFFELRVKDTGRGIPPEDLTHIFDRFYQSDNSATRLAGGTGLGLALTKELVQLMGGEIQVQSQIGEGSDFSVQLPISRSAPKLPASRERTRTLDQIKEIQFIEETPELVALRAKQHPSRPGAIPQKNDLPVVLLIEDNRDVLTYIASCLEGNYQVEFAINGREGIEQALEMVPDLIVCDVMMPEKDGFEVCATLKKDIRTSHIPIIILTAKVDREDRLKGIRSGADVYLSKPFDKEELEVRLEKLLDLRRQLQARYSLPDPDLKMKKAPLTREDLFLKKLRDEIMANLDDETFGIAQLNQKIKLSRSQLHNKLRALTGQSTSIFIRSIRLEIAKKLLMETDLSISEIAYKVGFRTPVYFTQIFSESFGVPPSHFRQQQL